MGLVEIPWAIITRKTEETTRRLKRILAAIALIVAKRTKTPSAKSKRVSKTPTKRAKRKPQRKTVWKISPQETVYIAVLEKDGVMIDLHQPFPDAFIIVAQKPRLTKHERNKGIAVEKFNHSHYEPNDSDGPRWTFPENFPPEERKKIEGLSSEEYRHAMIKAGWTCYDTTRFYGPLSVKEVESEYPYDPV
jgi:hypothetical protein